MVATFLIDAPAVALVGLVIGAYGPVGRGRVLYARPAFVWAFVAGAALLATALLSYEFEPHWMWMGFVDPDAAGVRGVVYAAVLLYAVPGFAGYALGASRRDAGLGPIAPAVLLIALQVAVVRSLWDRYWPIPDNPNLTSVSAIGPAAVLLVVALAIVFGTRERRRLPRHTMPHWQRVGRVVQLLGEALFPPHNLSRYHAGQERFGERVVLLLSSVPAPGRFAFRLLTRALEVSPLFFLGRPQTLFSLSLEGRMRLWEAMLNHRLHAVANISQLVKLILSLHYYEREEVLAEIGVRPEGKFAAPGSTGCAIGTPPHRHGASA